MGRMHNIVVGYDAFERQEPLPALAIALAEEHGARLHVINVVPAPPKRFYRLGKISPAEVYAALITSRTEQLEALLEGARDKGIETRAVVLTGAPHTELIREALDVEADLLVVSDEPMNRQAERGFGTVTTKLLRECPCPVLATRSLHSERHQRILAAIDVESETASAFALNQRILELSGTLARHAGADMTVFHAWDLWGEQMLRHRGGVSDDRVDGFLAEARARAEAQVAAVLAAADVADVGPKVLLVKGEPREVTVRVVEELQSDLVVMGTVCRTGLPGLLIGNTAERILSRLSCSVVAVKPEGFVSPAVGG